MYGEKNAGHVSTLEIRHGLNGDRSQWPTCLCWRSWAPQLLYCNTWNSDGRYLVAAAFLDKTSHDLVNKGIPTFQRNLRLSVLDHPPDYTASHARRSPSAPPMSLFIRNVLHYVKQRKDAHWRIYLRDCNYWSE